jgi:glutamate dehydrogenase
LRAVGGSVLSRFEQSRLEGRVQTFVSLGAPEAMARNVALLRPLVATADIGDLARQAGWPEPAMATLYHQVGAAFDFDRLRAGAGSVPSADHFDRLAVRRLIEDLMVEQMTLTRAVAASATAAAGSGEGAAEAAVDAWVGPRLEIVEGLRASVDEILASGTGWTFAKLTIANSVIREIASSAG